MLVAPTELSFAKSAVQQHKESIYASTRREPLGKATITATSEKIAKDNIFGTKTVPSEYAKTVIFPSKENAASNNAHDMYIKSHKSFAPGEQVNRKYSWEQTRMKDPRTSTFGSIPVREPDGVKKSVNPSTLDKRSGFNVEPAVASKIYTDFASLTKDEVGKSKYVVCNLFILF